MQEHDKKFMVEVSIPIYLEDDLEKVVAEQKKIFSEMFYEGKLFSATMADDGSKMWLLMIADSESELVVNLDRLPITKFADYDYKEVIAHHAVQYIPEHSLN